MIHQPFSFPLQPELKPEEPCFFVLAWICLSIPEILLPDTECYNIPVDHLEERGVLKSDSGESHSVCVFHIRVFSMWV